MTRSPTAGGPLDLAQGSLIRMTDEEFSRLTSFVNSRYGLDLSKKRVLIEGRLSNELRRRGFDSFGPYLDLVLLRDKTGVELTALLNRLTTNLSYFMRENAHFIYLREQALPRLEQARPGRSLRFWSAGCSSGQEPYTIAMVLDDYFGARLKNWNIHIWATDISMNMLGKAKAGVYTQQDLQGLPESWQARYFTPAGSDAFQVCEALRRRVLFEPKNLKEPFAFSRPFDLIFCRNVMIYFDHLFKKDLVDRFYQCTAPGGYLFIGHSESITRTQSRYTYIQPAVYQRR